MESPDKTIHENSCYNVLKDRSILDSEHEFELEAGIYEPSPSSSGKSSFEENDNDVELLKSVNEIRRRELECDFTKPLFFRKNLFKSKEKIPVVAINRQDVDVGESESDEEDAKWDQKIENIWDSMKFNTEEKWKTKVKDRVAYLEENLSGSEEKATMKKIRRKRKKRTRKEVKRDPDFDCRTNKIFDEENLAGIEEESLSETSSSRVTSTYWNSSLSNIDSEEKWKTKVKDRVAYIDENLLGSEERATLKKNRRKRKKRTLKEVKRDPDFDYRANEIIDEENLAGIEEDSLSETSSSRLTSTYWNSSSSNIDSDGLPLPKELPKAKIIERSERLIDRLTSYPNVDGVIILLNGMVTATNMEDKMLVSYIVENFHDPILFTNRLLKDVNPKDALMIVTLETKYYHFVCGFGTGGIKEEDYSIMVFQEQNTELQLKPIHPALPLRDKLEYPKVWLKGLETLPITPYNLHLEKFRAATGLKPLYVKNYKNLESIEPRLRTGKCKISPSWRPLRCKLAWSRTNCKRTSEKHRHGKRNKKNCHPKSKLKVILATSE